MNLSYHNYSLIKKSLFILCLLTSSCGGKENLDKSEPGNLKDFDEAMPLGEMKSDPVETPTPTPVAPEKEESIKDQEIESGRVNENDFQDALDEPLVDNKKKSPVLEKKEPPSQIESQPGSSGPLKKIINVSSKIIGLEKDPDKNLIVAERYKITLLKGDTAGVILDNDIYKKNFSEIMPAIATITQTKNYGLWVGFTNGEILTLLDGTWSKKNGGPSSKRMSIKKIFETPKGLFIGSKGLYQWDPQYDRFMSSDSLKSELITDISDLDEDHIIFSTPASIMSLDLNDKTSKVIYNTFTGDFPITSINILNNEILLAGNQGILRLSKSGFPLGRIGTSIGIKNLCLSQDKRGIAISNANEVIGIEGQTLYRSATPLLSKATFCLFDDSKIFLTLNNSTVFSSSLSDLFDFIKETPKPNITNFKETYRNACQAADELIKNRLYSKQISAPEIDGVKHVFFNGTQTCPNNQGYMRDDGFTVISNENNGLDVFEFNNRKTFPLPEKLKSNEITKLFIDSKNLIYIGTKHGLYYQVGEKLVLSDSAELNTDLVSDILEDKRGNIWIATRIQNTDKGATPLETYSALHLKTKDDHWAHFGKSSGLNSLGISSLKDFQGNLYLGTPFGYSILGQDSKIRSLSKPQGLLNFIVEDLNFDSKDRLWLSHGFFQNGLSWIDNKRYQITNKDLGLFSNRISKVAEDDEDRIWVIDTGGEVGVYSYDVLEKISNTTVFRPERASVVEFKP